MLRQLAKIGLCLLAAAVATAITVVFVGASIPTSNVPSTKVNPAPFIGFDQFRGGLSLNGKNEVMGIYAKDLVASPVEQQTGNDPVPPEKIVQFGLAAKNGVIALLAHNPGPGHAFNQAKIGDEVKLVFGNGANRAYLVTALHHFQVLSPFDPYSNFRDLEGKSEALTNFDVFNRFYSRGKVDLVMQACFSFNGNPSAGRLFVTARPK